MLTQKNLNSLLGKIYIYVVFINKRNKFDNCFNADLKFSKIYDYEMKELKNVDQDFIKEKNIYIKKYDVEFCKQVLYITNNIAHLNINRNLKNQQNHFQS